MNALQALRLIRTIVNIMLVKTLGEMKESETRHYGILARILVILKEANINES